MSKEELIKILQDDSTIVNELNTNSAYIVQVEVGDMPREIVKSYIDSLINRLKEIGLEKIVVIPTDKGLGEATFREVKQELNRDLAFVKPYYTNEQVNRRMEIDKEGYACHHLLEETVKDE